jgi:hypothetical protein
MLMRGAEISRGYLMPFTAQATQARRAPGCVGRYVYDKLGGRKNKMRKDGETNNEACLPPHVRSRSRRCAVPVLPYTRCQCLACPSCPY